MTLRIEPIEWQVLPDGLRRAAPWELMPLPRIQRQNATDLSADPVYRVVQTRTRVRMETIPHAYPHPADASSQFPSPYIYNRQEEYDHVLVECASMTAAETWIRMHEDELFPRGRFTIS
jgi:hypothetical protein